MLAASQSVDRHAASWSGTTVGLNSEQDEGAWAQFGLDRRPRVTWFPRSAAGMASQLPMFQTVDDGEVDAILFAGERRTSPNDNLRDLMETLQVPILDLTGRAAEFADVRFDATLASSWAEAAHVILTFRSRRQQLKPVFLNSVEPELQLLSHAYVSGRPLAAKLYPIVPEGISYPGYWSSGATIAAAEQLVKRGLLSRSFYSRMHECGVCQSRRMVVREECNSCRSANLTEVELIHHFHCATLVPETKFQHGSRLVCPKCSQHLRNYGKDYDRPGRAQTCEDCHKVSSEPDVGFLCMDCDTRCDGDAAHQVDIYSYALTDAAVAFLTKPKQAFQTTGLSGRFTRTGADGRVPDAVAEISYKARPQIVEKNGEATFDRLRRLFVENMRNFLDSSGELHSGKSSDYLLLFGYDDELGRKLTRMVTESESVLSMSIEPSIKVATKTSAHTL